MVLTDEGVGLIKQQIIFQCVTIQYSLDIYYTYYNYYCGIKICDWQEKIHALT